MRDGVKSSQGMGSVGSCVYRAPPTKSWQVLSRQALGMSLALSAA
jgi:hypothetical protein